MRRLGLALAMALSASPAAANPLDAFGFGARSIALGGAVTASVDDFSANYYNPAALARSEHIRLDVGYLLMDNALRLDERDLEVDEARGFQGGMVLPGTVLGQRVAVSVGLYLPDARITRLRALPQAQPRFVLFDNRPQRIVITSSAALEIVEDVFFGFGVTYLSDTRGVLDMGGKVHLTDEEQSRLLSSVNVDISAVRYPSAGLLWTPGHHWRFGLTWRDAFALDLDLDVRVHGEVFLTPGGKESVVVEDGLFLLNSTNHNLFSPRQFVLGVAYEAPRWLVGVDVGWLQWGAYPASTAAITIDLELDPLNFNIPAPDQPRAPGFHDIIVPRIGGEYRLLDGRHVGLTARAGYFYEPTPAPDQPGLTNYVDTDKHGVSAGLGLRLSEITEVLQAPLTLDVAGQYIHLVERRYHKTEPADPIGDYVAGGRILGASASLGLLF